MAKTRHELENIPCVDLTEIRSVNFAKMYNGKIYTDRQELCAAQESDIRRTRDEYLVKYVDTVASNPLRWADMSPDAQNAVKQYRQYLLDFDCTRNTPPKTFTEFSA